jgi:predicted DNA-binding transcriptional regulator AlpA
MLEKELLDYQDAAYVLSITPVALRNLVHKGNAPTITKIGRRVFFSRADIKTWIEKNRVISHL